MRNENLPHHSPFSFISFRPRQIETKVVVYEGKGEFCLWVGKTSILF